MTDGLLKIGNRKNFSPNLKLFYGLIAEARNLSEVKKYVEDNCNINQSSIFIATSTTVIISCVKAYKTT